jgi:xanthine/uracil permease
MKAVEVITHKRLSPYVARALIGDGLSTMVSGFGGGPGTTTYAENIGVMAATRVYSTLVFVVAAVVAVALGFSPKFGALIQSIPVGVLGGMSIVLFGLIAVSGVRVWQNAHIDFSDARHLMVAAVALTIGAGNLSLTFGGFSFGGIATATLGAIVMHHLLKFGKGHAGH